MRLEYLKGSKEKMAWALEHGIDGRMWNVFNSPRPDLHPDGSTVTTMGIAEMLPPKQTSPLWTQWAYLAAYEQNGDEWGNL